jgi:hypothetical protein
LDQGVRSPPLGVGSTWGLFPSTSDLEIMLGSSNSSIICDRLESSRNYQRENSQHITNSPAHRNKCANPGQLMGEAGSRGERAFLQLLVFDGFGLVAVKKM